MQLLKILFWVALAVLMTLFYYIHRDERVTIYLWGGLVSSVSMPFLLIVMFLLGFAPTMAYYKTRLWRLRRRYEAPAQTVVANAPHSAPRGEGGERIATDAKAWPAS